jgi:hypothetical protein
MRDTPSTDCMDAPDPGKNSVPTGASEPGKILADAVPEVVIPVSAATETNIHIRADSPPPRNLPLISKLIERYP